MVPGHRHILMFAFTLHLFLSFMSRALTIPMPEFLLFALYHFSDFFYGRRIYILRTLQRWITNICSMFHTFCIAIGALKACMSRVCGVRKRKDVALTANDVLLRLAIKSITTRTLEDRRYSFVLKEPCAERSKGLAVRQRNEIIKQITIHSLCDMQTKSDINSARRRSARPTGKRCAATSRDRFPGGLKLAIATPS
jgi:hypothetical protein